MVPYVGSHDVPRLTSRADTGTNDAFNNGQRMVFRATWRCVCVQCCFASLWVAFDHAGAPLLYYGDEYGEYGGADPTTVTCTESQFVEFDGISIV